MVMYIVQAIAYLEIGKQCNKLLTKWNAIIYLNNNVQDMLLLNNKYLMTQLTCQLGSDFAE